MERILTIVVTAACLTTIVAPKEVKVTVKTGSMKGAGTDCSILIQLVDVDGHESGWSLLNTDADDFELGSEREYNVYLAKKLNYLQSVRVNLKPPCGQWPEWYLEEIRVHIDSTTYGFRPKKWLNPNDSIVVKYTWKSG